MKIEDQVISLEFAKRLKELGAKQDAYFCWENTIGQTDQTCWRLTESWCVAEPIDLDMEYISAFTVSELGEILPHKINLNKQLHGFWVNKFIGNHIWSVGYGSVGIEFGDVTEANARAKLLIHLIESGIVASEKLK